MNTITSGKTYRISDLGKVFRAIENSKGQLLLVDMNYAPHIQDAAELKKLPYVEFYLIPGFNAPLRQYFLEKGETGYSGKPKDTEFTVDDVAECSYEVKTISLD